MHFWKTPQPFIEGADPQFPAWTKRWKPAPGKLYFPAYPGNKTDQEYVDTFNSLNNLKPHPVQWITPSLGHFG